MLEAYDFAEDFEDDFLEDDLEDDLEDGYEGEEDELFSPEDIDMMESIAEDFAEGYEDFEDEDAFLGALAGLAAKALPAAVKAAPMLLRAGRSILGRLTRSRTVRSAARAVPHIMRRTAADQLRRYSRGRPVTTSSTLRSAARHTANALHPRNRRAIIQRHRMRVRRAQVPQRRYPGMRRPAPARMRRVCTCRWVRQ